VSGIGVRIARNVDIPAIEALVAAAFDPFVARTGIVPAPLSTDWETVISALGASAAVRDDRLVGVLVLWPHPDHVLIDTLAVAPDAQASGVGGLLLEHAGRIALSRDVHVVRLYSNAGMTESLAWYARRGFVETGRGVEDGFDRVHLEAVLP
jgi:N-acetylglutamate synthase-like GNAT family acetyltransferase